jgi:hypothetical protein
MSDFMARAARLAGQVCALAGWAPDTFWRATPEVAGVVAALAGSEDEAAASADDLRTLMEKFPDG